MSRFKISSTKIGLPDFDGHELLSILKTFVKIEEKWVPPISGYSLYLRPLHISMEETLGVKVPDSSQILIMASPVGPYYPTGFNPVSIACGVK